MYVVKVGMCRIRFLKGVILIFFIVSGGYIVSNYARKCFHFISWPITSKAKNKRIIVISPILLVNPYIRLVTSSAKSEATKSHKISFSLFIRLRFVEYSLLANTSWFPPSSMVDQFYSLYLFFWIYFSCGLILSYNIGIV